MTRRVPSPSRPEKQGLDFDLSFRPTTYWPEDSLRLAVLGNIKGQVRRQLLERALDTADPDFPPEGLLKPTLEPELRDLLGKMHPMFMGGEYLPDYEPREVEIARVSMQSTTGDVISIRAREDSDGLIHYRVADEYDTEFTLPLECSEAPITFGELLRLIDETEGYEMGLVMPILRMNCESDCGDRMREFITASSDFYPELARHYQQRCNAFIDALQGELEEE